MDKKTRIIIFIILAIIAVITGYLIATYVLGYGGTNDNTTANEGISNVNNAGATVENTVENNTIENNVVEPQNTVSENTTTERPHSEVSYADADEQAMKIAKDAWGDTEGVYFNKETPTTDGKYVITVTSNATVLARYTIDVDTGVYDVEYR